MASELLLRNFNPSFPSVDCGVDVLVDGGIRIQVKCGHLRYSLADSVQAYKNGAYWFKLQATAHYVSGNNNIRHREKPQFSSFCDFVVLWGIEDNRFWVVPAALMDGRTLVVLGPTDIHGGSHIQVDVEKVKRLYEQGLTMDEIGERMNVDRHTISRRLKGLYVKAARTISSEVRQYEGRWDLIESYYRTLQSADIAAATPVETL